jgi:hypothetical protein
MKKGVGSNSQRYGSGDPDPDPHQNVTDHNTVNYEDCIICMYICMLAIAV